MSSILFYLWDMGQTFERAFVEQLAGRLLSRRALIQVLIGPRQVGKTTGIKQLLERYPGVAHYASADDQLAPGRSWLLEQWQKARLLGKGTLLVIDEIQKVADWSEALKSLWDQHPHDLRVVVLGSSSLQIQTGLTESLAGRFELIRVFHWTFAESRAAFRYSLDRYLTYGGYPGAVPFERDFDRWYAYLKDSIVESVIGKDILLNRKVGNPALFRQALEILCRYPAQEISYTKLLGQLQKAGNTDLVKYYIELYAGAFLVYPLQKFSAKGWLSRSSSPKILLGCPALFSMHAGPDVVSDAETRGHLFESAVGAQLAQLPGELFYWRERNSEVDFVYKYRNRIYAIEVKSGRKKSQNGLDAFCSAFPNSKALILTPEMFSKFSENPSGFLTTI